MKSMQLTGRQMVIVWPAAPKIDCSKFGASKKVLGDE
jgi:hypothetical protein